MQIEIHNEPTFRSGNATAKDGLRNYRRNLPINFLNATFWNKMVIVLIPLARSVYFLVTFGKVETDIADGQTENYANRHG